MTSEYNDWRAYYDETTLTRSAALRREYCVDTAGRELHVDAYLQPNPAARMILINHGWGSYSRMFVPHALQLHALGYAVLVADQRGQGFSSPAVDSTLAQQAQDVLDVAHWARRSFSGPLFLAGVNQGGALAYYAAGLGAPVVGLILHQLYDFNAPAEALARSRYAHWLEKPGGARIAPALAAALARILLAFRPGLRLSFDRLANTRGILDERDNGRYEAWRDDPRLHRTVGLRFTVSQFSSPQPIPYEENALPVLVINPIRDRMIAPAITRRNADRLSGPKTYVELDYGHWSMTEPFARDWAAVIDRWIKGLLE